MSNYSIAKKVDYTLEEAVYKLKEELNKEGFGILTEINVKETLKKKLDVDFTDYIILGACNPPFAYKALTTELEIGLMLPCNIIVYKKENNIYVAAIKPTQAMGMIDNTNLKNIAQEIENKLKNVVQKL